MPDAPILELQDVVKQYEAPDGAAATPVLRGITLAVAPGESLAVVGPSGSGKSTLLNIMGTLDRPTSGRVLLEGRDLADLGDDALAAVRNRRIGFVFQLHHLLPQCTALENVLVPTLAPGARSDVAARSQPAAGATACSQAVPPGGGADAKSTGCKQPVAPEDPEARARRLLSRVGLAERLAYRPGQLSGGERQRVAVARALINRPAILLADEPAGSLDRASAEELSSILAELNRADGMTLVVVTHSSALAGQMSRRLELKDGRLAPVA
jgi:predicted ABC-type transport system involved in lysophospholipase L1 biosynthesis ATPase subunit